MAQPIHRGLWFFRLFMMCASLVCILLMIDHLKHNKISIDAFTGAHAEEGITARIDHSPLPEKMKREDSKPIDKVGEGR